MFKRVLSAALVFGAASLAPPAAHATAACGPRDIVVEKLESGYKEALVGGGLSGATHLLEVWSSAETGSFTILLTQANGTSCILAAGQNWHGEMPAQPVADPGIAG